jgi:hypothetical protein
VKTAAAVKKAAANLLEFFRFFQKIQFFTLTDERSSAAAREVAGFRAGHAFTLGRIHGALLWGCV